MVGGWGMQMSARRRRRYVSGRGINHLPGTNCLPLRAGGATHLAVPALPRILKGAGITNPAGIGDGGRHVGLVVCVLWPP